MLLLSHKREYMNIKALESRVYDVLCAIQHTSTVIDERVASIALNALEFKKQRLFD